MNETGTRPTVMKAAVFEGPGRISIQTNLPVPAPRAGEVRIRVRRAGICGSDAALFSGKLPVIPPRIPGHEAVGEVDAVGETVTDPVPGTRVAIQPNFSCGRCPICISGRSNICPDKIRLGIDTDGVFAEYVVVPAAYTWPVPDALPDETAALTEPFAVAAHGLRRTPPVFGDRVLVIGTGVIGLMTLALLHRVDVQTGAFDIEPRRLETAEQLGAAQTYSTATDIPENAFTLIYDTSGAPGALALAVDAAAPGGRIGLSGLPAAAHPVSTTTVVRKELSITGAMIYTDEFPDVLRLLSRNALPTGPFTNSVIPLRDVPEALAAFSGPDRIKILVRI